MEGLKAMSDAPITSARNPSLLAVSASLGVGYVMRAARGRALKMRATTLTRSCLMDVVTRLCAAHIINSQIEASQLVHAALAYSICGMPVRRASLLIMTRQTSAD